MLTAKGFVLDANHDIAQQAVDLAKLVEKRDKLANAIGDLERAGVEVLSASIWCDYLWVDKKDLAGVRGVLGRLTVTWKDLSYGDKVEVTCSTPHGIGIRYKTGLPRKGAKCHVEERTTTHKRKVLVCDN